MKKIQHLSSLSAPQLFLRNDQGICIRTEGLPSHIPFQKNRRLSLFIFLSLFLFSSCNPIAFLTHRKCLHLFPSNLSEFTLFPELDETYTYLYSRMIKEDTRNKTNEMLDKTSKTFEKMSEMLEKTNEALDKMSEEEASIFHRKATESLLLVMKLEQASGTQRALQVAYDMEDHCPTGFFTALFYSSFFSY